MKICNLTNNNNDTRKSNYALEKANILTVLAYYISYSQELGSTLEKVNKKLLSQSTTF